ncbi:hypothetical protein ES705_32569 [subsurface metagenome]
MIESNDAAVTINYDTTINVIGGLRDCGVIFKAIESHFSHKDTLKDLISGRNEFNLRTERSRKRIERAINRSFLTFKNKDHRNLIQSLIMGNGPDFTADAGKSFADTFEIQ